jgi:hypothetical protein
MRAVIHNAGRTEMRRQADLLGLGDPLTRSNARERRLDIVRDRKRERLRR